MLIDNKHSPFGVHRSAGAQTSYAVLIESIERQLRFKFSCTSWVEVEHSNTTDSVYFHVSFKDHTHVFRFSLRNHEAHETYKGQSFLIQAYKNETHLFKVISNALLKFNEVHTPDMPGDEISPFGEALLAALQET